MNYLAAEAEKNMIENNASREGINAAVTIIRYQFSLNIQVIQQLIFLILGGTAITFIISSLLKRTRRSKPIQS